MTQDIRKNKLAFLNVKSLDFDDISSWASTKEIETFVRGWDCPVTEKKPASGPQTRGRKRHRLSRIVNTLQRYAPAFDVFVQQQPVIATITWGACRFLVLVSSEPAGASIFTSLHDAFMKILCIRRSEATVSYLVSRCVSHMHLTLK